MNLTCSFHWLLQTQPDLFISLTSGSLSVKGAGVATFLCGFSGNGLLPKAARSLGAALEAVAVRVWQGSEMWVFDFTGE